MKHLLQCVVPCVAFAVSALPAQASDYPTKPIRIVVPYPAGGSTDALARMAAQKLAAKLGQAVVVENRPGASEMIAATYVARSAPDGYTILLTTMTGLTVNPGLYGTKLSYNPQKDFVPIMLAATIPSVLVVNPSVPAKSTAELLSYLKGKPGAVSYASAGNGTPSHLGMELYKKATGVDVVHVPYKGGAPALQELMGGQVQVMFALMPEAMPMAKAGKLKALAITTQKRSPTFPDLPTVAESGVKDFEMVFWSAFMAPTGTPKDILAKLNSSLNAVLAEKGIAAKLAEMGMEPAGGSSEQLSQLINSETSKWKRVIDVAGIKLE
ncbi:Bug family tripartite tricarboxylate transporter substrate binding protein [Cupriavidus sp. PET2-C1]